MAPKYGYLLRLQDRTLPQREYSILVPYSETSKSGKTCQYTVVQKVTAPTIDDAIAKACHEVFECMVSAELRGDIHSWNIDEEEAHEYKPRRKCA